MTKTNITSNILENITKRISTQGFSNTQGKALVVFNGTNMNFAKNRGFIEDMKKTYEISIGFSFMAERLLDTKKIIDELRPAHVFREEDMLKLKEILKDYSILVGPNISMNTLSKVSTGMVDSFISNIIWSFLYFSKEVYLDFDSVREFMGERSKNEEIERIIENHISTVIKMGALEINSADILNNKLINKGIITTNAISSDDVSHKIIRQKGLISEKDIVNLDKNQNVLIVEKNTLITPLARDKAKELGIKIEKK